MEFFELPFVNRFVLNTVTLFRGANALYSLGYMVAEVIMALNILVQWAFTSAFLGTIQFRCPKRAEFVSLNCPFM
jgi:hypothetical protein